MPEAGRFVDRDGVAASFTYCVAIGKHGGLVRWFADALQFQRATAAAEDRGAVPKWLVTILLFFELSLLAGERTCGRGRGGGVDLDVAAQDRRLRFDVGGGDRVHRGVRGHYLICLRGDSGERRACVAASASLVSPSLKGSRFSAARGASESSKRAGGRGLGPGRGFATPYAHVLFCV